MKTVTINFTAQTNVVSDYDLGRIGEHNATELVITPPTSLSGDSRTALYRVQFRTGSEIVTSESYTEVPFTVALWQQLTEHSRLSLQVVAYDANGEYIGKSDKLSGFYFNASVSGTPAEADEQLHGLEAEIAENTAARHTHSNKAILDDINFTVPKTVNGKSADGNREITLEADDISAASGWTPLDDTDLATKKYVDDNAGGKSYEILSSTPSVSNYTGAELWALFQAGERITYKNIPISYGALGASNRFIFSIYEFNSEGEPGIRSLNYVTSSKNITERTLNYFIKSINSVSVPSNGNITVTADKINAPSGWSPTSDTQLATKKYVDDNSGGGIVEKVLELECDWEIAAIASGLMGSGTEIVLFGDQTAEGGLLHNAIIVGIDGKMGDDWGNVYGIYIASENFFLLNKPFVVDLGGEIFTLLGYSLSSSSALLDVVRIRIHYIETDGTEVVNNA